MNFPSQQPVPSPSAFVRLLIATQGVKANAASDRLSG